MRFIFVTSLAALLLTSHHAAAEGINCEGSSDCGTQGSGIMSGINGYIQNQLDPSTTYYNNVQLACKKNYSNGGGVCAFLQNTGGITGSNIQSIMQDLVTHGCGTCGSVPVFYPTDNNVADHGELTVNYVESPSCEGLCV